MTLKEKRKALKISRAQMGEKLGVGERTVGTYEEGTRLPPIDKARRMADELGLTLDELYEMLPGRREGGRR